MYIYIWVEFFFLYSKLITAKKNIEIYVIVLRFNLWKIKKKNFSNYGIKLLFALRVPRSFYEYSIVNTIFFFFIYILIFNILLEPIKSSYGEKKLKKVKTPYNFPRLFYR